MSEMLEVNEIFTSVDGEVNGCGGQGTLSTFIRFQGCNLACPYCDTKYAQKKGKGNKMEVSEILTAVYNLGCNKVTITGGEPLIQPHSKLWLLFHSLWARGYTVSVETNGTTPLFGTVNSWVVDYKLDAEDKMNMEAFKRLVASDYVKFVITSWDDYYRAKQVMAKMKKDFETTARFAFSPVLPLSLAALSEPPSPKQLLAKMAQDQLFDVQLNLQLHKLAGVL